MSDLKDFVIENYKLISYKGKGGDIVIPSEVRSIGELWGQGVFAGQKKITSVLLNDGLRVIGQDAFKSCTGIKTMLIPATVQEINFTAFDYCSNLEQIEFSAECQAPIACTGCKSLAYIKAPESTIALILKAVSAAQKVKLCYGYLNSGDINSEYNATTRKLKNKVMDMILSYDNDKAMEKFLACYTKPLSIDDVDELLNRAFGKAAVTGVLLAYKNKQYTSEEIAKNKTINEEKDLGLKERTLAEWRKIFKLSISKTEIGISGYKSEESVVVIPEIIDKKPVTSIQEAFNFCEHITTVWMADTITHIAWSFQECTNLTNVKLSSNLKGIGLFAFRGCTSLKELHIPASVTKIDDAFGDGCKPTIYSPKGSYAEQYAKKHKFKFVEE